MANRKCARAIVLNGDKMLVMLRNKFGMHYTTLVGGILNLGEEPEAGMRREVQEETGLQLGDARLVWVEDAGDLYGEQYMFLCEYLGGEPVLPPGSEEAEINKLGQNIYEPAWLPLTELPQTVFRSDSIKQAILGALQNGFPEAPQRLAFRPESVGQ